MAAAASRAPRAAPRRARLRARPARAAAGGGGGRICSASPRPSSGNTMSSIPSTDHVTGSASGALGSAGVATGSIAAGGGSTIGARGSAVIVTGFRSAMCTRIAPIAPSASPAHAIV